MRIILLEDDSGVAAFLRRGLGDEGYDVEWIADGEAGIARLRAGGFDAAIVDVMLPGMSGLAAIAAARAAGLRAPVLVLSARDAVDDRVRGLDQGADDYLVKPFAFAELLARLKALTRRAEPEPPGPLARGAIGVDPKRRVAALGGQPLALSPTELAILEALARRTGEVVARRDLLRQVWGYRFDPGTNVIDVHVGHLRRKLDAAGAASRGVRLVAVRGIGYRLEVDE